MKKLELNIPVNGIVLKGDLAVPGEPKGFIIFSHGSGSSRLSPRNRFVADELQKEGFATLLFDLLTAAEDIDFDRRFDIDLLTQRLTDVTRWLMDQPFYKKWNIGYFGASTGAASALKAAAGLGPDIIKAVVSRGGRPDLAMEDLPAVNSPVLLLVGGRDIPVIKLNEEALEAMHCKKHLEIVTGASHLFEERGTLEKVTSLAKEWFSKYLFRAGVEIEKDFMDEGTHV